MPRTAHYWRASGKTSLPTSIVVFDTETRPREVAGTVVGELHTLRLGHALAYRLEGGRRTRIKELAFTTRDEFWTFLLSRLSEHRHLWVYAHNMPFDLGVVGGWQVLQGSEWAWGSVVLTSSITLLRGVHRSSRVVFCDTCNYFHSSLAQLGEGIGVPKLAMPGWEAPDSDWAAYCRNDVLVTAAAVDKLIEFWRLHDLGPWKPTIGSLAMTAYLHRFMHHYVLVHTNEPALRLERAAYYGGRVDTPFIGTVPASPVWECDFNSLYPSQYREKLPIQLALYEENPKPIRFQNHVRNGHAIADVTVTTSQADYPLRERARVLYPVGTFRTALAGAELLHALESGRIRTVHAAAFYQSARVFQQFVDFFSPLKERYEREGNWGFRMVVKILENSLYGKTGQLTPRWMEWGAEALRQLELAHQLPAGALAAHAGDFEQPDAMYDEVVWPELLHPLEVRHIFGVTEVAVARVESRDSVPAIAACVTALARRKLRRAQERAGPRHWFYSDTDSLWVDRTGLSNVQAAGLVGAGELGKLDVRRQVGHLTVHGRKDYETETFRKLKGIRGHVQPTAEGVYPQLHFPGSETQLRDNCLEGVLVRKVLKTLRRNVDWCTVGPDGFTRPLERGGASM